MLTDPQVRALLAAAMSYDNRKPGNANVAAWTEAATRGRWTFDAALDAIHAHYAASTDFLMPGHITQRIKAEVRYAPNPDRPAALPAGLADTTRSIPAPESRPFVAWPSRKARRRRLDDEGRARARAELDARRTEPDGPAS